MPITDDELRKIRLNHLTLPECREALSGFLAAAIHTELKVDVPPSFLDIAIGIYAEAVQTGAVEMARALQAEGPEAVEVFLAKAQRGWREGV